MELLILILVTFGTLIALERITIETALERIRIRRALLMLMAPSPPHKTYKNITLTENSNNEDIAKFDLLLFALFMVLYKSLSISEKIKKVNK